MFKTRMKKRIYQISLNYCILLNLIASFFIEIEKSLGIMNVDLVTEISIIVFSLKGLSEFFRKKNSKDLLASLLFAALACIISIISVLF